MCPVELSAQPNTYTILSKLVGKAGFEPTYTNWLPAPKAGALTRLSYFPKTGLGTAGVEDFDHPLRAPVGTSGILFGGYLGQYRW